MAKKKNHTNHNQNKKHHRNGIKRVKFSKKPDFTGVNPKIIKNNYYAVLHQKTGGRTNFDSEE
ncbi:hypothetical protein EDEG_00184 [Edhazardia aedis USNM 41457]|uniref:60S ribosomal protein L29 n=1 Tax=Edhazardia aedis (strain USNM 41457) TaxID=1003232 RepID=J9D7E0_EDHAE|nr:hypothetical protein EDEG_00184 [Edhazardia aedis USNM 41457]|eukprot:EJW03696.1 hypothetical protein EDEG_00184 [Edhazardia aedis USNM 41457]